MRCLSLNSTAENTKNHESLALKEIAEIINKGNPEKPITEYKIKRIISKARRSAEGSVVDKELLKEEDKK